MRGTIKKAKPSKAKIKVKGLMDLPFLVLVLVILTLGLVMLFSASHVYAYYNEGNSFHFISRQLVFAVVGVIAMLVISRIDYHILHKLILPLVIVTVILMLVVLAMPEMNGARRWIYIGPMSLQPSEIAKFAVIVLFAHLISINQSRMKTFKVGVLPFMIILGITAGLMVLQPHLSGTILIMTIGLIMMFVGGTALKWFAVGGGIIAAALTYVVLFTDLIQYAMTRLQGWFDPFSDPQGTTFQTLQSLYAIGSGGLMGYGLGNSRQKYLYVPEPQNDFVFSIVCEELGFIGACTVIVLFALLVWRGFVIAMRAPDKFGAMLAVGLTVQVGLQAALNIAVVTNTIPNTGISMPFFSYGGTALMMLLAQMGVILSISRGSRVEKVGLTQT